MSIAIPSYNMRNNFFNRAFYFLVVLVLNIICLCLNIYYANYLNSPMQLQALNRLEIFNTDLTLMQKRAIFMSVLGDSISRDFIRYKCNNLKRMGGYPGYIKRVPDDLYRFFFLLKKINYELIFNIFRL